MRRIETRAGRRAERATTTGRGRPSHLRRNLVGVLLLAGAVAAGLVQADRMRGRRPELTPLPPASLGSVRTWGYQLQNVAARRVPEAVDLLVIDYSEDGSDARRFTPERLEQLRQRTDGRRRLVLAYLSIGEAETYRWYWRRHWQVLPPDWLGPENHDWPGNYAVRYWSPAWQRLIVDPQPSLLGLALERVMGPWVLPYVDRVLEAGFDGLYLDRVDGFQDWLGTRPGAADDMARFIGRISAYARARRPGAVVFIQNGEELLERPGVLAAIDGIAKEDLLFGEAGDEVANAPDSIRASIGHLGQAKAARKSVLVVEYLEDATKRADAETRIRALGYPLIFARRALNEPAESAGAGPARRPPASGNVRPPAPR